MVSTTIATVIQASRRTQGLPRQDHRPSDAQTSVTKPTDIRCSGSKVRSRKSAVRLNQK